MGRAFLWLFFVGFFEDLHVYSASKKGLIWRVLSIVYILYPMMKVFVILIVCLLAQQTRVVDLMLDWCWPASKTRWANVSPTLGQRLVFAGSILRYTVVDTHFLVLIRNGSLFTTYWMSCPRISFVDDFRVYIPLVSKPFTIIIIFYKQ